MRADFDITEPITVQINSIPGGGFKPFDLVNNYFSGTRRTISLKNYYRGGNWSFNVFVGMGTDRRKLEYEFSFVIRLIRSHEEN